MFTIPRGSGSYRYNNRGICKPAIKEKAFTGQEQGQEQGRNRRSFINDILDLLLAQAPDLRIDMLRYLL